MDKIKIIFKNCHGKKKKDQKNMCLNVKLVVFMSNFSSLYFLNIFIELIL